MRSVAIILAALLVVALAAPAPAVAQSDEETEVPDELFDSDDEESSILSVARGLVGGLTERISLTLSGIGSETSATAVADDASEAFNDRAGDFADYANPRVNASTDYDVLAVTFEQDGEEDTRYVVADVSDGDYQAAEMVDSTDRGVDEECTLAGAAARNADAELERFHDRFVADNETVTKQYMSRMASKYGDPIGGQDVTCTFMEG